MGDYRLQAFHDINAEPVGTSYVQTRSCIDKWAPRLAEETALGEFTGVGFSNKADGLLKYENGVIVVNKERQGKY
jgi:hypothetical protein